MADSTLIQNDPRRTPPAICSFDGCARQSIGGGLCVAHYAQRSRGEQVRAFRGMDKPARTCKFDECPNEARALGYCTAHRGMQRRGVKLSPLRAIRSKGAPALRDAEGRKECGRCRQWLALEHFNSDPRTSDGLENRCTICSRDKWLRIKYGITSEDYAAMWEAQGGNCAICGIHEQWLCVDHCHESDEVRGLLCKHCNSAIGLLRDEPDRIRAAARYVEGRGVVWQMRLEGRIAI